MPEVRSALQSGYPVPGHYGPEHLQGVTLQEDLTRDLVQVTAWAAQCAAVAAALEEALSIAPPKSCGVATTNDMTTLFQVAPGRYWVSAPREARLMDKLSARIDSDLGAVTDLGHSRTTLRISGPAAREVLARGFAIDLDPTQFGPGAFAQTIVHHIGVMVHRPGDDEALFELLVLRTYALSFWEWLFDTAQSFGCTLEARKV